MARSLQAGSAARRAGGTADADGAGALFRIAEHREPGPREAEPEGGLAEAALRARSCGLIRSAERGTPTVCQAGDTNWASLHTPLRTSKPVYSGRNLGKEGSQGADPPLPVHPPEEL